jgi:hypothetical protein
MMGWDLWVVVRTGTKSLLRRYAAVATGGFHDAKSFARHRDVGAVDAIVVRKHGERNGEGRNGDRPGVGL